MYRGVSSISMIRNNCKIVANDLLLEESEDSDHNGVDVPNVEELNFDEINSRPIIPRQCKMLPYPGELDINIDGVALAKNVDNFVLIFNPIENFSIRYWCVCWVWVRRVDLP